MSVEGKKIFYASVFPILFVIVLWLTWLVQINIANDWMHLGVYPRETNGLLGILTSVFIHSSVGHLFSNTIPLLMLGWCLFYFYKDLSFIVLPCLWLLSGLFTWLIGREAWHVGASGLIFALSFFLFFSGIIRKYIPLMAVSLLVAFVYGSTIWSMLPIAEAYDPKLSWEGHLSGAIAGTFTALMFYKHGPQKPIEIEEEEDDEEEENNENNEEETESFYTKNTTL
jgi:Uncharacterized membrane protein (homolog of Drosophila rhomboid)